MKIGKSKPRWILIMKNWNGSHSIFWLYSMEFPSFALSPPLENPKFQNFSSSKFTLVYFSQRKGQTNKWIFTKLKYIKLQNKRQLFVKKKKFKIRLLSIFLGAFCIYVKLCVFFRYKSVSILCEYRSLGCGDIGSKIICLLEIQFHLEMFEHYTIIFGENGTDCVNCYC